VTASNVNLVVVVPRADPGYPVFLDLLTLSGVSSEPLRQSGLNPVAESVIAISVAAHAGVFLLQSLRTTFRRGIVVDGQAEADTLVRVDASVPRGVVIIRSKDGDITIREHETLSSSLLQDLIRGGKS